MNKKFNQIFLMLESDKTKLLSFISSFDNETLNLKPDENKWSIAQILFHVVKGEQYALISFLNSLKPEAILKQTGISTIIKSFILNLSLRTNYKFKAPVMAQKVPETVNTVELLKKWEDVRKQIKDICLTISDDKYNKGVFKHPFIGMINLKQTLNFLSCHLKHHLIQIEDFSNSLKQK